MLFRMQVYQDRLIKDYSYLQKLREFVFHLLLIFRQVKYWVGKNLRSETFYGKHYVDISIFFHRYRLKLE
ncbi:hypothetical protein D3C80_163110 [compost metagenome]